MLVLTRKIDQSIKIGEDIEVTILGVSGDMVKVGIEAPRDIRIFRNEVYEEVQRQNEAAMIKGKIPHDLSAIIRNKNREEK